MKQSWLRFCALGAAALGAVMTTTVPAQAADAAKAPDAVKAAEGLWAYTLLRAGGSGKEMPLTGVILYKDGLFVQQSIFEGEPFETQGAMAHAGPFGPGPRGIHMVAEQTISTAPGETPALEFRRDTQHDISVDHDGEALTLVFGSGTTQKFRRIGPANGDMYKLDNGVLALVDGHFVLVAGDAQAVVTGYGTFSHQGAAYAFDVIRWAEGTPAKVTNRKSGTIKASFDGKTLTLADGRAFHVAAAK